MDVGPKTAEAFAAVIKRAKTIVWNGYELQWRVASVLSLYLT